LVEDNGDLREVLREHFSNNYKVIEAENGKDALAKTEDKNIDIVLSDIMMPEMDGIELVKVLRDDIKTSHLPIALLTAKSSVEDQIAGTEAGADLYFPKPFNLKLMDLKMKQFLESRQKLKDTYASNVFAESRELVRTQKDKEFLERFVELVDENIDNNDFTIDQICREMSIGRTNMYKKIRSLTGQSMGEFIRGLRLKKAAKILITEDVSISEVLYRVGINSNSYFTKSFKSQFGMTPTEFIHQNVGKYN
jgi:DNA-binding response OmpR family regulator